MEHKSPDNVREAVRKSYGEVATASGNGQCCGVDTGCCGVSDDGRINALISTRLGYSQADLDSVPAGADMGLGCGNPKAIANLKAGEWVLDLGSGGGFDAFLAAREVGESGRVIGVDMTPEMLAKARANARKGQFGQVEFRLGEIEHLPVADASVDVVISNCVLNLSPDKAQVWREIARVLKPGGRVAVSDLALLKPLPDAVRADLEQLVGCVAGAVLVDETRAMAEAAGLTDIELVGKPEYIKSMEDWQDPLYRSLIGKLPEGSGASDYITSLDVTARKG
jgi:SAM-dependent methyltransferase